MAGYGESMSLEVHYDHATATAQAALSRRTGRILVGTFAVSAVMILAIGLFLLEGPTRLVVLVVALAQIPVALLLFGQQARTGLPAGVEADTGDGPAFTLDEQGVLLASGHSSQRHLWADVELRSASHKVGQAGAPVTCLELIVDGDRHLYPASGLTPPLAEIVPAARELRGG